MGGEQSQPSAAMAQVAADVSEETAVPMALLGGYLRALVAVAGTSRRLAAGSWTPATTAGSRPPPPACRCRAWSTPT